MDFEPLEVDIKVTACPADIPDQCATVSARSSQLPVFGCGGE
ncbi:hypothetical protein AB0C21_14510 [Spirillospora sp. NPDC049024]